MVKYLYQGIAWDIVKPLDFKMSRLDDDKFFLISPISEQYNQKGSTEAEAINRYITCLCDELWRHYFYGICSHTARVTDFHKQKIEAIEKYIKYTGPVKRKHVLFSDSNIKAAIQTARKSIIDKAIFKTLPLVNQIIDLCNAAIHYAVKDIKEYSGKSHVGWATDLIDVYRKVYEPSKNPVVSFDLADELEKLNGGISRWKQNHVN